MKATGIVRKVDELGRIVLPIELRRTLNIRHEDPIEIFVDGDYIIMFVLSWYAKYGGLYLRIKLDIERNGYFLVIPRFGGFSSYYRKEYNGEGFRSCFHLPICENTW